MVNPRVYTHDPAYVDCRACMRTVYMADAELTKQQDQPKDVERRLEQRQQGKKRRDVL